MIPQAIVVVTVTLTLKSDAEPVHISVNKPRGTVYWGGAGLNGPYIQDQVSAFQEVGIKYIWIGKRTIGDEPDAIRSGTDLRYEGRSDDRSWMIEGMEKVPAEQFNLIGYSYGSLMAAQTAHVYASNGHIVDHLVLVASPIDGDFLEKLQANKNIKKIIVVNLTQYDDPIFAGMPQWKITISAFKLIRQDKESGSTRGIGHFYYRPNSEEGRLRRRQVAGYLYRQGLR
jgi:pimeloyl-ACP methyl ester carboxylesterase